MNEFSWFWISGAVAICAIAFSISYANTHGTDNGIEYAKAGLEECVKDKRTYSTLWVKDCVRYLHYIEGGVYTSEQAQAKTNNF